MKKTFFFSGIFFFCFFIISCKPAAITQTAEVSYLTSTKDVLKVRSIGYGVNRENALANAQKNVFENLFFRGIPNSEQNTPLISADEKDKAKSKKYFAEFYDKEIYKTFLTSIQPVSDLQKVKGGKGYKIMVDIGISLNSLRRNLEENGVIRKFGY